jgi:hypothetical protein
VIETTQLTERASLKFTFGVYNLANATSFDIPINNVPQQPGVQPFSALWGVPLCSSPRVKRLANRQQNHWQPAPDSNDAALEFFTLTWGRTNRFSVAL